MPKFTSDFHLGHKVIVPKYREFASQEEHDNLIFDTMSILKKRDILFILGDFIFDSDKYDYYVNIISKMSCRIKLVLGNHDSKRIFYENRLPNLELQLPLFSYKNMWVSHCPIHPQELRKRIGCIHGHLHNDVLDDKRYFEVGLDKNKFNFVELDEIKEYFKDITI